jgi:TPR repeat protein
MVTTLRALAFLVGMMLTLAPAGVARAQAGDRNSAPAAQCGQAGGHGQCVTLALQHRDGTDGRPRNIAQAGRYFLEACKYGDAKSCFEASQALQQVGDMQGTKDALVVGCRISAGLCVIGWTVFSDPATAHYEAKVVEFFLSTGCRAGEATACLQLGAWFDRYDDPFPDTRVSYDLARFGYAQACAAEESPGFVREDRRAACYNAFVLSASESSGVKDDAAAVAALSTGCEIGALETCARLALAHESGWYGLSPDVQRAKAVADAGCAADDAESCQILGSILYREGSQAASVVPLTRACVLGKDPETCKSAARIAYRHTSPGDRSRDDAIQTACREARDGWACYTFGYIQQVEWHDYFGEAGTYVERGCTYGYAPACDWVTTRDRARARAEADRAEERRRAAEWAARNPPRPPVEQRSGWSAPSSSYSYVSYSTGPDLSSDVRYQRALCRGNAVNTRC